MIKYNYKFQLDPTKDQEILLNKHFGSCRYVYNHFLDKSIKEYETNKKLLNYYDNAMTLPNMKLEFPWLKEINSQSLQYSVKCLQNAYDNFFRRLKEIKQGKKQDPGFPTFKSKHNKQSFRVTQYIKIKDNKLIIRKFLEGIKINLHKEVIGEINFATISKSKSEKYFVNITTTRSIDHLPKSDKVIGIDLNIKDIVDSNGVSYDNPRPDHKHKKRLRLLSKEVSRCKSGSKNKHKANKKLARYKEYCHNIREDFQHKLSHKLINENQVICCEDLSVSSMLETTDKMPKWKQKKLHRDLQDVAFHVFVQKLSYKASWYGRELIKVDRWFPSSQICNHCDWRYHDLPKDCKEWCCHNCFEWNKRDINSAKNVLVEGIRIRTSGTEGLAYCPDVRPNRKIGLLVG